MTQTPEPIAIDLNETRPFFVDVNHAGLGRFATAEEAYESARSYRDLAEAGRPVAFTDHFGRGQFFARISVIEVFRWNPLAGERVRHARSWRRRSPVTVEGTPLEPLPAEWHLCELPADWYGGQP